MVYAKSFLCLILLAASSQSNIGRGVIDGDTFETDDGKVVRVLNINTPELGTEQGKKAYYFARKLLSGKKIMLIKEGKEKGKYGRYLYHAILPDGTNFAERMIRRGHSRYYKKHGKSRLYGELYKEAERRARKERLGIWKEKSSRKGKR